MRKSILLTAFLSAATLTLSLPASAQVGYFDPGLRSAATTSADYTEIQFRRDGRHGRGGFHNRGRHEFRHGGHGRHYGGGYRGHRGGGGIGVGAGIAGLAAGAIIGGAIASQATPAYAGSGGNAVAYCSQKFRSYDPSSGTYLGYDGNRHACP